VRDGGGAGNRGNRMTKVERWSAQYCIFLLFISKWDGRALLVHRAVSGMSQQPAHSPAT
jgi:hypothetical protein